MSLVDQFLEENELLEQYTQEQNVQKEKEPEQKKQSLHELKKKYNFYNDSDDSSDSEADQEKSEEKIQRREEVKQIEQKQSTTNIVRKTKYSFSSSDEEQSEVEEKVAEVSIDHKKRQNYYQNDDDEEEDDEDDNNSNLDNQEEEDDDQEKIKAEEDDNEESPSKQIPQEEQKPSTNFQKQTSIKHTIINHSPIQEDNDEDNESVLDFYQLSDLESSNLLSNSIMKVKKNAKNEEKDSSPKQDILRSSISKVASMLDSQIQNYDKLLSSSYNLEKQYSQRQQNEKPQTEMTFGDLSSSDGTFYDKKQLNLNLESYKSSISQSQQLNTNKVNSLYQKPIQEEEQEESSQYSMDYSNVTQSMAASQQSKFNTNLKSKNFQNVVNNAKQESQNNQANLVLRILLEKLNKEKLQYSLSKWKEHTLKDFFNVKLKNAAQMVDKMSKFSRSFISLNSLNQIILKNKQRNQAKVLIQWVKFMKCNDAQQTSSGSKDETITGLKIKLQEKEEEIQRMEQMFREYSNWRSKLEQIESKMKSDVEYWKSACDKLQKENEKLQKEALKVTQQLMERTKESESKQKTIENLQQQNKSLETVDEAVCPNCRNSLEESTIFTGRTNKRDSDEFHNTNQQINQEQQQQIFQSQLLIKELSDKLNQLEKEVMIYRERVSYHESVEEELKKNIESQVDVVLKMEEERLILLKENKEMKEKCKILIFENDEYKSKISLFERELEELQEQIKVQMQKEQEKQDQEKGSAKAEDENCSESDIQSQVSKMTTTSNKENKSLNKMKSKTLLKGKVPKKTSGLKFQTTSGTKVGENSAIFSSQSQLKQQIAKIDEDKSSKYGVEPINKSLVNDNQILTNELVMMNREISKLKTELRYALDKQMKTEKERYDIKKNLDAKENALEKLRKEKDELLAMINTEKYTNIKTIEKEKDKVEKQKQELEQQVTQLKEEQGQQDQKLQQLLLKIQELEFSLQRMKDKDNQREKLVEVIEDKSRKYERELTSTEQQCSNLKKEVEALKGENQKLKKDVDWLANSAKNNKLQAERAISDLEQYTKILRGMEKKLAESEIEREQKDSEVKELRNKLVGTLNQLNQQQSMIVGNAINNSGQWQQNIPHPMQPQIINQQQQWSMQTQHQQQQQQQQQMVGAPRMGIPQPHQPPQRF